MRKPTQNALRAYASFLSDINNDEARGARARGSA
jgi:hypothetical protein